LVNLVQGLKNIKSIELIKLNFDDYSSIKQNLIFPGQHNFYNACFTSVVAQKLGLDSTKVNQALAKFVGLKRRFELIQEKNQIKYYDDYAHHPYEITQVLQACRQLTNGQVIAVFEPHTYSRTKVLFDDFAKSFSQAHQVILVPIFPSARERPDPTVSSLLLSESISNSHHAASYQEAANLIKQLQKPGDLVITLGAGNIYRLHQLL
jgi:UDP-N-acetylmuramate--alanine ligase